MKKISKSLLIVSSLTLYLGNVFAEATPNPNSQFYGEQLCVNKPTEFICHRVQKGESWKSLFPDLKIREKVMRINRRNTPIYPGFWVAVPVDLQKDYMEFAPCPFEIPPVGKKLVRINAKALAFCAYTQEGKLIHWGPISSGKNWCPDIHRDCSTPEGSYTIFNKKGRDCESDTFPVEKSGGAKMPYCMFFYRGYALHASTLPGFNESHGCVRMFYKDAIWLNRGFVSVGNTTVEMVSNYE